MQHQEEISKKFVCHNKKQFAWLSKFQCDFCDTHSIKYVLIFSPCCIQHVLIG